MKKGFTLIELLIVITIIGILSSIVVIAYANMQARGRDAKREEDMHTIQNAEEQYYGDNSYTYPPLTAPCSIPVKYLPSGIPVDPTSGNSYANISGSATCSTASYCWCAALETTAGNAAKDCSGANAPQGYLGEFCVRSVQN
jgi:prepilin-type N-terminal cleavage/methylation domain-containing protein